MKKRSLVAALAGCGLVLVVVLAWLTVVLSHLPDVRILKHYRPPSASQVLDKDGRLLAEYHGQKLRIWVPIADLPDSVIQAVTTAEDDTFFEHRGINYKATWDALVLDVQKRRYVRGGSTITQQMIKNVLLSRDKTLSRKVREYVLARRAEEILTKRRILEIYLNEVEWGNNLYGIEAASRIYCGKHAADLSVAEAALLAGMLPNPRWYNPVRRPERVRERRDHVLFNMQQARLITQEEYALALATPLPRPGNVDPAFPEIGTKRPCWQQALEQALRMRYGERGLSRDGLTIRTTLAKTLQEEIGSQESAVLPATGDLPARISVIIDQEGTIRGISCLPEEDLRNHAGAFVMNGSGSIGSLSLEEISGAQGIVRSPR